MTYCESTFENGNEVLGNKNLNHRALHLSFLEIEKDGLYDILEQAFDGNYENLTALQHYDQIKLLFPSFKWDYISDLPTEMIFETAKNLDHGGVVDLCVTHSSFSELCSNGGWLKLLRLKYPSLEWKDTKPENAEDTHKTLQEIEGALNNVLISLNHLFIYSAGMGNLDILKYLMSLDESYGIDPSAYANTAIIVASQGGYLDIVEYFKSLPKKYGIFLEV